MSLKYKFALTVFLTGLTAVLFAYLLYFSVNKSKTLQEANENLLLKTEDIAAHLITEIKSDINIADTAALANSVRNELLKSNNRYKDKNKDELKEIKSRIENNWKNNESTDELLSNITGSPAAEYLKKIKHTFEKDIGEIFLTDKYGITAASTGKLTTLTHSEKYWWKNSYNNGKGRYFIDDRGFDESVSGYVLGVTVPVVIDDKLSGILKINFNLSSILRDIVNSGEKTIIARTGGLIVMGKGLPPLTEYLCKELYPFLENNYSSSGETVIDSEEFITAAHPLNIQNTEKQIDFGGSPSSPDHSKGNNNEGWVIFSLQKKSNALKSLYDLSKIFFFISLLIIILLAVISLAAGAFIVRPFRQFSRAAFSIGEGDFSAKLPVNRKDEFGVFAAEINKMAENLSATTAHKEDLENEIEKRHKEEKKYSRLFNTMTEGFASHEIITDEKGFPVDYRFLSINPAFEKYTGLKASEAVGKTVLEIFPETEPYWIETYGKVALTGEPVTFENYSGVLDKHFQCSAFAPQKGNFAVVFTDVTKQKNIEKELENEKEQLAVTLRSIGDGVITTDINGNVVLLNNIAESLTGWKNDEACGKPMTEVFNIINEFTRVPCENPVEKVLATGNIIELANHTSLISRDSTEYIIEDSAAPIKDKDNRIIGVVLVFRDSTEKKKLSLTSIRNQKLESLAVLAGGIAHDFNNLLSGIFGYIELAKSSMEMKKYDLAQNSLLKTLDVFDRTKNLTQQLLTFSKGGNPKREQKNITEIIRNSAEFALSGSKHIPVYSIDDDLWLCSCDENQISQCIDNIIINSKQAMPMGGEIKIKGKNTVIPPEHYDKTAAEGNYIEITIEDTGIGIPAEIVNNIFDPFFTTKETGHGLGLATVHSIIKHHDGWINVYSKPGKGTEIKIYLPASIKKEIKRVIVNDEGKQNISGQILIMDDEDFIIDILENMLGIIGYKTVAASDGDEAVKIIAESYKNGNRFAACILDLTIPNGKGGLEAAGEIRKISEDIVIIASSGYSDDPVISNPVKHGFSASLRKPFKIEELSNLLKENIGKN